MKELLQFIRENNYVLKHTKDGKRWYQAGSFRPWNPTKFLTDEELIKIHEKYLYG